MGTCDEVKNLGVVFAFSSSFQPAKDHVKRFYLCVKYQLEKIPWTTYHCSAQFIESLFVDKRKRYRMTKTTL